MGGSSAAGSSAMQMLDAPDVTGPEIVHQNTLTAGDAIHTGAAMMGQAVVASDRQQDHGPHGTGLPDRDRPARSEADRHPRRPVIAN